MDHKAFDELARSAMAEGGTRRALVRLLAGSALAGAAARLGLIETVAAKAKRRQATSSQGRKGPAERKAQDRLQAEGQKKRRKKKRRTPPASDAFSCPAEASCQVLLQDTAAEIVAVEACPGDGEARALCSTATKDAGFRALTAFLRAAGFVLTGDPRPAIDFYEMREDGTRAEDVIILRFGKGEAGEEALLRFGRKADGQQTAYAMVQQDGVPVSVLAVDAAGEVARTPVAGGASGSERRDRSRRAQRSAGARDASNPDDPYDGQANELCGECSLICKTLGSIECGLLVILLSGGSAVAGATLGPLCNKPAEVGCVPFCNSMVAALLVDDPQNCGACGRRCAASERCCQGQCMECCPNAPKPQCIGCEEMICRNGSYVCQTVAAGVVCPAVPETYWPHLGRTLPEGCCPSEKYLGSTPWGYPMCVEPVSGGTGWRCD